MLTNLDVLIGLVLVYLLLSLTCSAAVEWLAGWRGWRAYTLENAITALVGDSAKAPVTARAVFEHPLVRGLTRDSGPHEQKDGDPKPGKLHRLSRLLRPQHTNRPSYLSADSFTTVLLDLMAKDDPAGGSRAFQAVREEVRAATAAGGDRANIAKILHMFARESERRFPQESPAADSQRLAAFTGLIHQWFEDAMERASGWYKRKTQAAILCIGLLVAGLLNIDMIAITRALYRNPGLRDVAVSVATRGTRDGIAQPELQKAAADLEAGLPVGWNQAALDLAPGASGWGIAFAVIRKIAGLLATAVGVTLGAPFWFDILGKLVNLRSAGAKPVSRRRPSRHPSRGSAKGAVEVGAHPGNGATRQSS